MDPWENIDRPRQTDEINARRFAPWTRWDWYVGRDARGRRLLLLNLDEDPTSARMPVIQGLEVRLLRLGEGRFRIEIALNDSEARQPFRYISDDLVSVTEKVQDAGALPAMIAERLETWRRLWRKQHSGVLSEEAQRGLVAELCFLRDTWLGVTDAVTALRSWEGPEGGTQDFRIGFRAVEVKSRPPEKNSIVVSSADQLWFDGELFVVVYPIASRAQEGDAAVSLNALVQGVWDALPQSEARETFNTALLNAGYIERREYDEERFVVGAPSGYEVVEGFPAIRWADVPSGVEYICYSIGLNWCEEYRVDREVLRRRISGSS